MEKGKGRKEGIKINEMGALQGEHRFEDWIVQAYTTFGSYGCMIPESGNVFMWQFCATAVDVIKK